MKEMYSIVQREVNPLTAKIKVRVCESGTKEELTRGSNYCRIRSLFNQELTYYLIRQENSKEALKKLKKKKIEKDDFYIKIE